MAGRAPALSLYDGDLVQEADGFGIPPAARDLA